MTANPLHPRWVEIPGDASFRVEEGAGFRTYIASIPGRGETRIEIGWDAIPAFEDCVVGRVLGQVSEPEPNLLADGVSHLLPPRTPPMVWCKVSPTWFESGPWVLSEHGRMEFADGRVGLAGWYLSGRGEEGIALGAASEAPTRAAEAWIAAHPRRREAFPGERGARRMLRGSSVDPTDPAQDDVPELSWTRSEGLADGRFLHTSVEGVCWTLVFLLGAGPWGLNEGWHLLQEAYQAPDFMGTENEQIARGRAAEQIAAWHRAHPIVRFDPTDPAGGAS